MKCISKYGFIVAILGLVMLLFNSANAAFLFSSGEGFTIGSTTLNQYDIISTNGSGSYNSVNASLSAVLPPEANIDAICVIRSTTIFSLDADAVIQGNLFHNSDLIVWNGTTATLLWSGQSNGLPQEVNLDALSVIALNPLEFIFSIGEDAQLVVASVTTQVRNSDIIHFKQSQGFTSRDFNAAVFGFPLEANLDAISKISSNSFAVSADVDANIPSSSANFFGKSDLFVYNSLSSTVNASPYFNGASNGIPAEVNIDAVFNILPPPSAAFFASPTTGNSTLVVTFTDTSLNSPDTWAWSFGDGSTSNTQNPSHNYTTTTAVNYSVTLIASNIYGTSTVTKTNYIHVNVAGSNPPNAGFYGTPTSGFGPLSVTFQDTSANNPTSWAWDFGDGNTSSTQNPNHLYSAVSSSVSYTVRLIVSNAFGTRTATQTNYITIFAAPQAPLFTDLPDLKLFVTQPSLVSAFDLADYNIGGVATTYSLLSNFLTLGSLVNSVFSEGNYNSGATSGSNYFIGGNGVSSATTNDEVKYSTYKINKLPQVVLRPSGSWSINVFNYTSNISGPAVPPSFGNVNSIIVSDLAQVTAFWSDNSTVTINALAGFNTPVNVDVIAAPVPSSYGIDIDKERIGVYPSLATTAFEFGNGSDTTQFGYQIPAGATGLASVAYVASISDPLSNGSHGGALKVTFSTPSSGIKITPKFNTWLANSPGSWYTLRVRVFGTNTANNYLQVLYNGNPGVSPTDIQGYFKYSISSVWAYYDIPVNSFSAVSSAPVMYPQLVLKANGATGIVYIDEMEIFQATPPIVSSRYLTSDKYIGGYWNDGTATTKWAIQSLAGSPSVSVANGQLVINTSSASTTQVGLKFTASTSGGTIYTVAPNVGKQAGMHMKTKLLSGTPNVTLTQVQVNLLGTKAANSFAQGGDIAAAAEVGRISNRTLRLAFFANNANYQVQFVVKNSGTSTINIDNSAADIDNDDPNYGDAILFP